MYYYLPLSKTNVTNNTLFSINLHFKKLCESLLSNKYKIENLTNKSNKLKAVICPRQWYRCSTLLLFLNTAHESRLLLACGATFHKFKPFLSKILKLGESRNMTQRWQLLTVKCWAIMPIRSRFWCYLLWDPKVMQVLTCSFSFNKSMTCTCVLCGCSFKVNGLGPNKSDF